MSDADYAARWKARCVITSSGCWEWQGFCQTFRNIKPGQRGYPAAFYRTKNVRLHRQMLEFKLGRPLGLNMHGCHTCDNPPCINPDHLYEATNQQNHIDGGKRKRMQGQLKTHCMHGHEFTPDNTYWSPRKTVNGVIGRVRNCKECNRIRQRRPEEKAKHLELQRARRRRRMQQVNGTSEQEKNDGT